MHSPHTCTRAHNNTSIRAIHVTYSQALWRTTWKHHKHDMHVHLFSSKSASGWSMSSIEHVASRMEHRYKPKPSRLGHPPDSLGTQKTRPQQRWRAWRHMTSLFHLSFFFFYRSGDEFQTAAATKKTATTFFFFSNLSIPSLKRVKPWPLHDINCQLWFFRPIR